MEITSRQVCDNLLAMTWLVKATMFRIAETHDLTPGQLFAMHAIMRGGNTMGRVAEIMHCDASNVTGLVDRLVAQGRVLRIENENDRRAKTLSLTEEGSRIMEDIFGSLPEQLGCNGLSPAERAQMQELLNKLTNGSKIRPYLVK